MASAAATVYSVMVLVRGTAGDVASELPSSVIS